MIAAHDPGGRAKPKWPAGSAVSAGFSECGHYRNWLLERWDYGRRLLMWLMMNPSVANIDHADPTLIRTGNFSRRWGYGAQVICNVHAYRITDSKLLAGVAEPAGPDNDQFILHWARQADAVVLAYGQPPKPLRPRATEVVKMLQTANANLKYLRLSQNGTPCHPLYLPSDLELKDWPT